MEGVIVDLLVRVRRFLVAVSTLFEAVPDVFRAGHLKGRAESLAREIEVILKREGFET